MKKKLIIRVKFIQFSEFSKKFSPIFIILVGNLINFILLLIAKLSSISFKLTQEENKPNTCYRNRPYDSEELDGSKNFLCLICFEEI